jgi:type I restriction enzyme, S subunit
LKKGWQQFKLSDVCELINGRAYSKPDLLVEGKYPVLRVGNFFTNNHWYYSDLELGPEKYCDHGDLLYAWSASFGPRIWEGGKVIFHYHIWKIQPDVSLIDKRFLFMWLLWDTEQIKKDQGAGTTMLHVSKGSMEERDILVPPLAEQQRITGILDEAFEGLANAKAHAEKNLQNARALFESHLQSIFTQRGPGWVETTLDEISTNLDSKRIPITKSDRISGGYRYYGASGVVDYVADYIFDCDALLVSEDGANLLARSTPIAFSVSGKYWVNNHAHILKFDHMATQRFVEFYLESIKLDEYITGAAQPKLNQKALNSIPIPLPKAIEEQADVVASLEGLQSETQRLAALYTRKLSALEALKKSLLHQAFSGAL